MSSVLQIQNVDHFYRVGFWMQKVQVLHQISFSISNRSIVGFLGANGAGKTSLIHLITGLRRPSRGEIKLFGIPTYQLKAKLKLGYLPERPYFHEHLTGEDLMKYMASLSGLSKKTIMDRIPKVLSAVGMSHAKNLELKKYSKGMLQRIGIAQALIHDPEFLVLDEPMSGLDPAGRKEMRDLILQLSSEGRTVFFSSHVIPDVEAICDQVVIIQKGKLLGFGSIDTLLSEQSFGQPTCIYEIAFSGIERSKISDWNELESAQEISNGIKIKLNSVDKKNSVLEKIVRHQGEVLWVNPQRPSLENLFNQNQENQ